MSEKKVKQRMRMFKGKGISFRQDLKARPLQSFVMINSAKATTI